MRFQIALLLVTIFLYLTYDGTDGQCTVPTLTAPLQWVGGTAPTPNIADGATADVECDTGYTLVGTATLSCSSTTLSALPTCEADCTDPGAAPTNGQKTGATYTHGSTVTYTCDTGYTLSATGDLTCSDGSWDNQVPTCTEGTATTEDATTEDDSENGAGVATFGYLMIPAVMLAVFSN
ncbi:C4b-binding protein beta chain-like isoform X2 [Ptychodera flava]|uniref:C4b-binding protein beta chain-like isoform X2 n=1 Tax=Ptychodera flava TaxID=63121 RepID=UPI003969D75B